MKAYLSREDAMGSNERSSILESGSVVDVVSISHGSRTFHFERSHLSWTKEGYFEIQIVRKTQIGGQQRHHDD